MSEKKTAPKKNDQKAKVIALLPVVKVPGFTLSKGGKATISLKMAKHHEEKGDVQILDIID